MGIHCKSVCEIQCSELITTQSAGSIEAPRTAASAGDRKLGTGRHVDRVDLPSNRTDVSVAQQIC